MICPHCGHAGRIEVTNTVQHNEATLRTRKCPSCSKLFQTQETVVSKWPAGARARPERRCDGASRGRVEPRVEQQAPAGDGAHLQSLLFSFVAPVQQRDSV